MSGLVVGGMAHDVPGLEVRSWIDQPTLRLSNGDRRPRKTAWVRAVILHTTQGGHPPIFLPGAGKRGGAEQLVDFYNASSEHNGVHLCIDRDGSIGQFADLLTEVTYHATSINEVSIGIELKQSAKLELYEAQLVSAVTLVDAITALVGIQRQVHAPYHRYRPVPRLAAGGVDCVGIFGHRDQTDRRGPGDPPDEVIGRLVAAGYEARDFDKDADKIMWRARQADLGITADGIPGPGTRRALASAGRPLGQWVPRPVDNWLATR